MAKFRQNLLARVSAVVLSTVFFVGTLSSCGTGEAKASLDYLLDAPVLTYNANTLEGAATGTVSAFSRVLTGFSFIGPGGESVADRDFGITQSVVGEENKVIFTISPRALYSDGVPVTCEDIVLSWVASSGRFPAFSAASTAGYRDISDIDCAPGAKSATVTFFPGRVPTNWAALFSATTLMPSHVLLRAIPGFNLIAAARDNDLEAMNRAAQFWNQGWNLVPGSVDLSVFPSSGPYKLDSYTTDEGLILVKNDQWWGEPPRIARIAIWTKGMVSPEVLNNIEIADIAQGSLDGSALSTLKITPFISRSVEQLVLQNTGIFSNAKLRKAFALCVPRQRLAEQAAAPGVVNVRLDTSQAVIPEAVARLQVNQYTQVDIEAARSAAEGPFVVRIGYTSPDIRRSAEVAAIAQSCQAAGITVQDVSSPTFSPQQLRNGQVDVMLSGTAGSIGPGGAAFAAQDRSALRSSDGNDVGQYANPRIDAIIDELAIFTEPNDQLRLLQEAEGILWKDLPTIPLYFQPRTAGWVSDLLNVVPNPTRVGLTWNLDRWVQT
ncbi:MAG: ABC transporter substrate-binding protein [Mycobacteriaceae bacterium]